VSPNQPNVAELATFRAEREHFRMLCTCEGCVHALDAGGTCAPGAPSCGLGFPNREHLEDAIAEGTFVFCKSFEAT
jgi:hypothetical protein